MAAHLVQGGFGDDLVYLSEAQKVLVRRPLYAAAAANRAVSEAGTYSRLMKRQILGSSSALLFSSLAQRRILMEYITCRS